MRYSITLIIALLYVQLVAAQKTQLANSSEILCKNDVSNIWLHTKNAAVLGFIGDNYQRIRVKFLTVINTASNSYIVTGKTMVKDNKCSFSGTMIIDKITPSIIEYENKIGQIVKQKVYLLTGQYTFKEDEYCSHAGVFRGTFRVSFYMDKYNKVRYNDLESYADGFSNNQFTGTWTAYGSKVAKKCNWGDYRIPQSGDLDGGAGEFSPGDKYLKYGWQSYRDADINGDLKAKKYEQQEWWK